MSLVALIVLALVHLAGLPSSVHLEQAAAPTAKVVSLPPHTNLDTPVKTGTEELKLGANSSYAWDVSSATPLYSQNPTKELPIASITKVVTALVILNSHSLDEIVTVPTLPTYLPEDERLGLVTGQKFRLLDLLTAALVPSDNDAADALALDDSGTIAAFSAKMNRLAQEWGIKGVHFTNPSGLSDDGNYANAQALAQIGKLALANSTFAKLVSSGLATISDTSGKTYQLSSTDQLLSDPRISGIKTGYTVAAGQCFVGLATIKSHQVITVVLGSSDRFGDTQTLINYLDRNYSWQ